VSGTVPLNISVTLRGSHSETVPHVMIKPASGRVDTLIIF